MSFNDRGMSADGKVQLKLPGVEEAEAQLVYDPEADEMGCSKARRSSSRKGLGQTEIDYTVAIGEALEEREDFGFTFHGIHGDVTSVYRDEKLSGEGKLKIDKGKATGSIHVDLRAVNGHPVFSGEGTLSYQIRDDLIATAGSKSTRNRKYVSRANSHFPSLSGCSIRSKANTKFSMSASVPRYPAHRSVRSA